MPQGPPQWSPPGPSPHSPAQACIIHFPRCRDGGVRAPFLFLVVTACFCSCMVGPRGSNVTVMVPTPRLPGETLLQLPAPGAVGPGGQTGHLYFRCRRWSPGWRRSRTMAAAFPTLLPPSHLHRWPPGQGSHTTCGSALCPGCAVPLPAPLTSCLLPVPSVEALAAPTLALGAGSCPGPVGLGSWAI